MNANTITTWPRFPEATLDHLAHVYADRELRKHGYTFEDFLRQPREILARMDRLAEAVAAGLEQRTPMHARELRSESRFRLRGDILIQKLWHGRSKRGRRDADGARRI